MNSDTFAQFLSGIEEMNKKQLLQLFQKMEDHMGLAIPMILSRDSIDEDLREYNKEPLSDEEWLKLQNDVCYSRSMKYVVDGFVETKYEVLNEIRPNWNEEDEEDNDEDDEKNNDES